MFWIRIGKKRIRIQLFEFYYPCDVFRSFRFFNEVIIIYHKSNKNDKKLIFFPFINYFGCSLCYSDPFRIRFLRHDADPDPAKSCGSDRIHNTACNNCWLRRLLVMRQFSDQISLPSSLVSNFYFYNNWCCGLNFFLRIWIPNLNWKSKLTSQKV